MLVPGFRLFAPDRGGEPARSETPCWPLAEGPLILWRLDAPIGVLEVSACLVSNLKLPEDVTLTVLLPHKSGPAMRFSHRMDNSSRYSGTHPAVYAVDVKPLTRAEHGFSMIIQVLARKAFVEALRGLRCGLQRRINGI